MRRIFATLFFSVLLCLLLTAQETEQTGERTYATPEAVLHLRSVYTEALLQPDMQGKYETTGRLFGPHNGDRGVYQEALGLSADQVTWLAAKEVEWMERSEPLWLQWWPELRRYEMLSPEELANLEERIRQDTRLIFTEGQTVIDEVLTPEQKQRAQELELVLESTLPWPSPNLFFDGEEAMAPFANLNAYEALGLSDEQNEALTKLQRKSGKELSELMEEAAKSMTELWQRSDDETDEKYEKERKALGEKAKTLKAQIRAKVLALLTKEQVAKLDQLLVDLPKKLKQLEADWKTEQAKKKPEDDAWREAWKPGDPVPEGAVPPRVRKPFPF